MLRASLTGYTQLFLKGERAATVPHFSHFYPVRTGQRSRISRGFWEGNDKATALPFRVQNT